MNTPKSALLLLLMVLSALRPATAFAQRLTAKTIAKEVLQGSTFDITYEYEGQSAGDFNPPPFDGFQVIGPPATGHKISIINGAKSEAYTYTFTLRALHPGTYTIPPASIDVAGKKILSNELTIKVVAPTATSNNIKDIFIEAVIPDTPAYPGSQINLQYVLYTRKSLENIDFVEEDDYNMFTVHNITPEGPGDLRVIDGRQYLRKVIRHVVLYPNQAGQFKLKPLSVAVQERIEGSPSGVSLFDRFFAEPSLKSQIISSPPIEIRVLNFPRPFPDDFSGATGTLSLEAHLSDEKITTNDAASLQVTLSGTSNPDEIKPPVLDNPNSITVFPPEITHDTLFEKNGQLVFEKTYEYLIQPNSPGDFHFLLHTSYFDKASRSFKKVKAPSLKMTVVPAPQEASNLPTTPGFFKENKKLWAAVALASLALLAVFWWYRKVKRLTPAPEVIQKTQNTETPPAGTVEKTSNETSTPEPITQEEFFNIPRQLKGKPFMKEMIRQAERFFEHQLNIPHADFRKEAVFEALSKKGIPAEEINQLKDWWQRAETVIYANMPIDKSEREMLEEIRRFAERLKN